MDLIKELADKYGLPIKFASEFYSKVIDKQNFEFGIKMFVDGWITYDVATGLQPICISEYQSKFLASLPTK